MNDITKLLRAIASGTDAQKNKHDIIFNAAAARIEALEAIVARYVEADLVRPQDEKIVNEIVARAALAQTGEPIE